MRNAVAFILSGYDEKRISAVETVELVRSCLNLSQQDVKDHTPMLARVPHDWPPPSEVDFSLPLSSFKMSARTENVLRNNNIKTIGDVYAVGTSALLRLSNFGRKSLMELRDLLLNHASERMGAKSE